MASFDPPCDLDDEVFVGPVTQRELIITWRKRRQERLERERAEALKNEGHCAQPSSVDGKEPDVKKLHVQSEEHDVDLEVTNDGQPSKNTSSSYQTAGQVSGYQQDLKTDCTSIEEESTEDNICQIDHNCVGNESKETPFVEDVSFNKYLSEIQDELMSGPMAMFTNPEESVDILKEDEETSLSEKSENYEEAVGEPRQLDAGSIWTPSKEASYSSKDESINEKCNEPKEIELQLFAEQTPVENGEDEGSTDDQSEIYEMSVDDSDYQLLESDRIYASVEIERDVEDNVFQIDNNCSAKDGVSINENMIEIQDELVSGPIVISNNYNPEKSMCLLQKHEDILANSKSENYEEAVKETHQPNAVSIETPSKETSCSGEDMSINETCTDIHENVELVTDQQVLMGSEAHQSGSLQNGVGETSADDQSELYKMSVEGNDSDTGYQPQDIDRICTSLEKEADVEDNVSQTDNNCDANESKDAPSVKDVSINENVIEIREEVSGPMILSTNYTPEESVCLLQDEEMSANDKSGNYEEAVEDTGYQPQDIDRICTSVEKEAFEEDNVFQTQYNNCDANESKEGASVKDVSINENVSEIREVSGPGMILSTSYTPEEPVCLLQEDEEMSANGKSENYEEAVEDTGYQPQDIDRICTSVEKEAFVEDNVFQTQYNNCDANESKDAPSVKDVSINENVSEIREVSGPVMILSTNYTSEESVCLLQEDEEMSANDKSENYEEVVEESCQHNYLSLEVPSKESSYSNEDLSSNKMNTEICESLPEPVAEQQVPIERKALQSGSVQNGVGETPADDQSEIYNNLSVEEVGELNLLETSSKAAPSAEDIIHGKSSEYQEPKVHVTSVDDKHHKCLMTVQESVQLSAVTDLKQSMEVSSVDDTSILNDCTDVQETESSSRLELVEHESECALIDKPKSSIEHSLRKSAVIMPCHRHSNGEVLSLAHKASTADGNPINHEPEENKENGPSLVLDLPTVMPEVRPSKMMEPPRSGAVPRSNIPKLSILKPATLNVDQSSLNTSWVKRINMSKIPKPKRPCYVQPLDK